MATNLVSKSIDAAGDARVDVGFITWMAKRPRLLEMVLERRPLPSCCPLATSDPMLKKLRTQARY
jgi:hypothetical protein